ncbi:holo-ACP synthase [Pedobacter sp.]|jgi:holo-[acyl-carrier protein] synthase|uniref:holo-ACP synthase n=1 Tax=Pedobacter sp. TaxID=1411316 RepID=UPI002BC09F0E|nr:holo-ACP synthase [Pedobacter sp.]HWW37730.1 holo-ACP synthase [Pedobacter sp.]
MIVGIGCDLVDHSLIRLLKWESDSHLLRKIFSKKEMDLYFNKKSIQFLAGRFAAKEAVLKSIGVGMQDGIALTEIETLPSELGKPEIFLSGEVMDISVNFAITSWYISLAHSNEYSLAYVIAHG